MPYYSFTNIFFESAGGSMGKQFIGFHIGTQELVYIKVPDLLLKDRRFILRKPKFVCVDVIYLESGKDTAVCFDWEEISPSLRGKSLDERLSIINEKLRSLVGVVIATRMREVSGSL